MPITSSAKKALRVAAKKTIYNLRLKNAVEKRLKEVRKLIAAGKKKEAAALVPMVQKTLDKAVSKKYLKKNTAARLKSRVAASIKKLAK